MAALLSAKVALADYLGTSPAQVVIDPRDIAAVLADGLQTGDQFRLIGAVTPGNTGSNSAQSGWNTFYTIPGMRVTRVEIVNNAGGGNYVTIPAKDTDAAYNGWGSRGNKNYSSATADNVIRLGNGFINQVQQDTGIFYSTDPRTKYVPGASAPPAPGTPPSYGTVDVTGGLKILSGNAVPVHNIWDRDQVLAFGASGSLSGNGGTGDTPLITLNNGALWRGAGSPIAGPHTYYTNDYNPNCGKAGTNNENPNNVFAYDYTTPGNPATRTDQSRPAQGFVPLTVGVNGVTAAEKTLLEGLQCIGPWRRIVYAGSKIGGPATPPTPALATGAIVNTATPVTAANKGDDILATFGGFLPSATNAIRFVSGARRIGDIEYFAVTIRITDVNQFLANAANMCVMSLGSDTADLSAKDNNWRYYEPIFLQGRGSSQYCIDLSAKGNLSKQATHVNNLSSGAQAISVNDVVSYTIKFTNTTAQTIDGLNLTDVVGPGVIIANGNLDLVNSGNANCAFKPVGGNGGHVGYNATFSTGSTATGGTLLSPADTVAGFPNGFNGPVTWNTVNGLKPGESVTVYMCAIARAGTQGDLLENEANASYTGCGTAPCFVSSAFSAIGNSLSGTVYRDGNSNGALDAGETGIAGVSISLYRDDGISGQFNATGANANTFVAQTTTGPDGAYNFTALPAGNYLVVETDLAGYTSTGNIIHVGGPCPTAGSANVCNVIGPVTLGNTGAVTRQDFYDFSPALPILTKSFNPTTIASGGTAVLTFTVNNSAAGSVAVSGLFFTDILPIGVVLANGSATAGGSCGTPAITDNAGVALAAGSTSVKVTGVDIPAGNICTIAVNATNFNGQLNSGCPNNAPDFNNTANHITDISPNTPPNGLINGVQPSCLTVTPTPPNLTVGKSITSVNGAPANAATVVNAGDVLVYTINVANTGGQSGSTTLGDVVPANTTYTGAVAEGWSCPSGSAAGSSCSHPVTVAAGATVPVTYTLTVNTPIPAGVTQIANVVTTTTGTCSPTCSTTNPTPPKFNTSKQVQTVNGNPATSATIVKAGDVIKYLITVTNGGGTAGGPITLTDVVPTNTTYTGTGEGWSCPAGSPATTSCQQTLNVVAPGATLPLNYTLTVITPLPAGVSAVGNLVSASIGTCTPSCSPSNPVGPLLDTVKRIFSVNGQTAQIDANTKVKAGDVIVYTLTTTNTGGQPGQTSLNDVVPANTTYSGNNEGWSCPNPSTAGTPCSTPLFTVNVGSPVVRTYTITVNTPVSAGATSIGNVATSTGGTCSSCTTTNPLSPIFASTKTIKTVNGVNATSATVVNAGDVIVYNVTVANTGGSIGSVTLFDTVPVNTKYTGAGEGWSCAAGSASGTVCSQLVTLAAAANKQLTYTLTVQPLPAGTATVANQLAVDTGTCNPCNPNNPTGPILNTTKVVFTVNGTPANATTVVKAGDVIVYMVQVTNGGGTQGQTTLSDVVPPNTTYTGPGGPGGEGWSCIAPALSGTPCQQTLFVAPLSQVAVTFTLTVQPFPINTTNIANLVTTSNGTCSSCNPNNPTAPVPNARKDVSLVNGVAATSATLVKAGDIIVYNIVLTNPSAVIQSTTLNDAVPANTRYTGTAEGWSCASGAAPPTVCQQIVSIPANGTITKTFTLTVDNPLPPNTATISNLVTSSNGTCTPSCTATNPTVPILDTIKVVSSVNGAAANSSTQVKSGDVIRYSIITTNTGGTVGTTTLSDPVPTNTSYTGVGEGWTCATGAVAGTPCQQSVTVAAAGGTISKFYTLTVITPLPAGTTNVANQVTSSGGTCSSCTPTNPTTPSLDTVKRVTSVNGNAATSATLVKAGDVILYTITVTNLGGQNGTTVLTDNVPANTRYTGIGEGWGCPTNSVAGTACTQSVTVAANGLQSKTFTVTVNTPVPQNVTQIGNLVSSTVGTCSSCTVNNPTGPILDTIKTVSTVNGNPATTATVVKAGDVIGYTITVTNTGGTSGTTVWTDTVPANTSYTGTGQGWSCATNSAAGTACTQSITVGGGASVSKNYTLTVNTPLPAGTTTIANVVASSVGTCSSCNPSNPTASTLNTSKVVTSVNGAAATAATVVGPGDIIVYTITVTNPGGQPGTTSLSDPVPANTRYTGVGEGWSCPANSGPGTACLQSVTVPANGTSSKTYTLTVNNPLPPNTATVANQVTTSIGTCLPSCNPSNPTGPLLNTSKVVTSVNGFAATPLTQVKAGDVIVYTITVTNTGGQPGTTGLGDAVPANTRYTGVGEGWSCPTNSVAGTPCSQSVTVAAGATTTKTYTMTVNTPLPPNTTQIGNVVTTTTGTCTPVCNPSNPTGPVLDTTKLVMSVNGNPATPATVVKAGDVIVYIITVSNTGGNLGTTQLNDVVPINTTYTGAGEGWSCPAGSIAGTACNQSMTVNAGASVAKTYTLTVVTPLPAGTAAVANLVTTSVGTCSSCNPSNPTSPVINTSKQVTSVNGAAATAATQVKAGDVIVYTITVTNPGGQAGTVTLADNVPANTTYTGNGEGWSCAAGAVSGNACSQSVTVPAGGTLSKTYTLTVVTPIPAGVTQIANLVTPSIGTCSPTCNPNNPLSPILNTMKTVTTVNGNSATASTVVAAGDVIKYTITVLNNGGQSGTTILTDLIPVNTTYVGIGEGWSCPVSSAAGTSCTQSVTVGASGGTQSVTYTLKVNTPIPAGVSSIANLVTTSVGTCSSCNPSNPTTVPQTWTYQITKTTSSVIVENGAPLAFTIVITNNGPAAADGSILTDPAIPLYTVNQVSCLGTTGGATCPAVTTVGALQGAGLVIPTFPAGATVTIKTDGISSLVRGDMTNTATISPPANVTTVPPLNANSTVSAQHTPVPTMSPTGLVGLILLVAAGSVVYLRRKERQG